MFAPDINTTKNQLTTLFNEITGVSGYSIGVQDTLIGTLPKEPNWIPAVRSEMQLLSQAGANWIANYPSYWPAILVAFIDYSTTFSAVSNELTKNIKSLSKAQVIELLSSLQDALQDNTTKTSNALDSLTGFEQKFTAVFPALNSSINEGWEELKEEEAEMIAIAEAITQLQDEVSSLQSKIDSSVISGGKTFVQTNVKIAYSILSAAGEVAVPYLSIVTLAYTIGKTFYDIISDTDKINNDLRKIADLQVKATEEAQAAAATKAVIQYLYNIEIQFLSLKKHGGGLVTMWKNEKSKITEAINAINAGADPASFLDILTIDIANKNWEALLNYTQQIINMPRTYGPDVILKTHKNLETHKN